MIVFYFSYFATWDWRFIVCPFVKIKVQTQNTKTERNIFDNQTVKLSNSVATHIVAMLS